MPIFATVDCLTNSSASNGSFVNGNEYYVGIINTLSAAQDAGFVTRIAYNSGSAVSGGLGNGLGYWDSANASPPNSWTLWRFNSSSYRPWEFYVLLSWSDTSTNFGREPNELFLRNASSTEYSVVYAQAALSYNPSTGLTTNPWNGTMNNDGTDKANVAGGIWSTGSAGYVLNVFPDANNTQANFTNSKNLFATFTRGSSNTTSQMRFNVYVAAGTNGGDGLMVVYKNTAATTVWEYNLISEYFPRPELTSSIKCPLLFVGEEEASSDYGASITSTPWLSGACGITLGGGSTGVPSQTDMDAWAKAANIPFNSLLGAGVQEIVPLNIIVAAGNQTGLVGTVKSTLIRNTSNITSNALSFDSGSVCFNMTTTTTNPRIICPWSSSVGFGPESSTSRTGSSF